MVTSQNWGKKKEKRKKKKPILKKSPLAPHPPQKIKIIEKNYYLFEV
jgi:hypothetical protein